MLGRDSRDSVDRQGGLDQAGVEALYVELEGPLFNVVYRWLWDRDEARDTVQEAFVRLHRKRAAVDPATAKAFVYRIALNLASNKRRSRRIWRWVGLDVSADGPIEDNNAAAATPADDIEARQSRDLVREAVEALPEKHRRVVMLTELSGLSYQEVAVILGVPVGTVASRRNHGLAYLRTALIERGVEATS